MLCLRSARTEDGRRVSPRSGGKSEGRWWGTPPRGGAARDSRRRRWRGGRERAGRWRAAWRCTLLSGLALAQKTASKTEIIGLQNLNENHDEASLVHSCIVLIRLKCDVCDVSARRTPYLSRCTVCTGTCSAVTLPVPLPSVPRERLYLAVLSTFSSCLQLYLHP